MILPHVVVSIPMAMLLALGQVALQQQLEPSVMPFVPRGEEVLAVERGDLNGDGKIDFVLVTEERSAEDDQAGENESPSEGRRTLSILTRLPDDSLKLAARSERVVLCRECGGIFGDPFLEVSTAPKSFTVRHYGGSNWRWTSNFTFRYSRKDQAWQLVKVEQTSFHVSVPDEEERHVYVPPRDFGKIDLVDFDPDEFLGKGEK